MQNGKRSLAGDTARLETSPEGILVFLKPSRTASGAFGAGRIDRVQLKNGWRIFGRVRKRMFMGKVDNLIMSDKLDIRKNSMN